MNNKPKMGLWTASAFVIANMIGTGVFCSLGFQLLQIQSAGSILLLWLVGGLIAFCGALSYSELGAVMPRSGGEYHYLSQIYHPLVGFLSGFTSIFVGFAAPVSLACMALSAYVCGIWPNLNAMWLALGILTVLTLVHATNVRFGAIVQDILTIIKILIILFFIVGGLFAPLHPASNLSVGHSLISMNEIFSTGFGVSLIWVYYAYSGWNASAYISSEIEDPKRNVPRSLLISTGFVILLYLLLNYVFLRSTPADEMAGQVEIGLISANHIFGVRIGHIVGLLIAGILMSSISSMIFVGARVSMSIGEDHRIFRFLGRKTEHGSPYAAVLLQYVVSATFIVTSSFELVTTYIGVLLSFFALLTVAGVFVHRKRFPNVERPYKTWGYPVTPLVFCVLIVLSIVYMIHSDYLRTFVTHEQPVMWMTLMSAATLLLGVAVYYINRLVSKK